MSNERPETRERALSLPFAVDSNNNEVSLLLGGKRRSHVMISGISGSGKTVLLKRVISELAKRYTPSDIVITIIDPRNQEYRELGADRGDCIKEAVFDCDKHTFAAILNEMCATMEERSSMLHDCQATVFEEFDYSHPEDKLSRKIICIDNIDPLTIHGKPGDSESIKNCLGRILRFGGELGISILFATQNPHEIARFFGPTFKLIGNRICMRQCSDKDVMLSLLLDSSSLRVDKAVAKAKCLKRGEAIFNFANLGSVDGPYPYDLRNQPLLVNR